MERQIRCQIGYKSGYISGMEECMAKYTERQMEDGEINDRQVDRQVIGRQINNGWTDRQIANQRV